MEKLVPKYQDAQATIAKLQQYMAFRIADNRADSGQGERRPSKYHQSIVRPSAATPRGGLQPFKKGVGDFAGRRGGSSGGRPVSRETAAFCSKVSQTPDSISLIAERIALQYTPIRPTHNTGQHPSPPALHPWPTSPPKGEHCLEPPVYQGKQQIPESCFGKSVCRVTHPR